MGLFTITNDVQADLQMDGGMGNVKGMGDLRGC